MWTELICGLVLYSAVRIFFYYDDADFDSSHFNSLFDVAKRLEKLYHGSKVYVGLRIPDPDSGTPQNIDIVHVTDQETVVISVTNASGSVSVDKDGNWACLDAENNKTLHLPNPVARTKQLIPILEEYLDKRGVDLPEGYFSSIVVCSNPKFRCVDSDSFPDEVFTYNQREQLKPEKVNVNSGCINETLLGGKKKIRESFSEKLNSVLGTAPVWDRLELKDGNHILGEFVEFRGEQEDLQLLRKINRFKVGRLMVQEMSTSSSGNYASTSSSSVHSMVKILYAPRDYRVKGPSWSSNWDEITVKSSTEIVFQPQGLTKSRKYKLSSIVSISLSA